MTVMERSELEASPLSDLHAIANQLGLDGFRRLRKAQLIDAILGEEGGAAAPAGAEGVEAAPAGAEGVGAAAPAAARVTAAAAREDDEGEEASEREGRPRRRRPARSRRTSRAQAEEDGAGSPEEERPEEEEKVGRIAAGVVELLGNGSAFLRVSPPDPSDEDVYISAAQVRRCELVSGDRVTGPVRTPRRSERYPSLVRVDTINGASADSVASGARYEELAVAWPSERIALDAKDKTLEAIEVLTPIGRGSRATICGPRHCGKTETLLRLALALHEREDLEVSVVLAGARPEEISQWREGPLAPAVALDFSASAEVQEQAVERALEAAKRVAARGGDAVVLIDGLDGLHPHGARRALAAARNLREAGSLTIVAAVGAPLGGETTVIVLDPAASSEDPIVDLAQSGTLRPELLVGEDGAKAIRKARAKALEG
jgi:transcription termination factor Rho